MSGTATRRSIAAVLSVLAIAGCSARTVAPAEPSSLQHLLDHLRRSDLECRNLTIGSESIVGRRAACTIRGEGIALAHFRDDEARDHWVAMQADGGLWRGCVVGRAYAGATDSRALADAISGAMGNGRWIDGCGTAETDDGGA